MNAFLKEPLVHFLVLGALIFATFGWLNRSWQPGDEIRISRGQQKHLINMFERTWQRPPTPEEFRGMLQDHIREEIAYREGIAMGFDQDDTIIRRRMRQKLELLTDEIVSFTEPTDTQLQQFLDKNAELFRLEPRLTLRQIYVNSDDSRAGAEARVRDLLEQLRNDPNTDWSSLGDPLTLPSHFSNASLGELQRQFGTQFADSLLAIKPGNWTGPIESGYGLHLVIIDSLTPARDPQLDEVRDRVKADWLDQRRREATDAMYQRLAGKYSIEIQPLTESSDQ